MGDLDIGLAMVTARIATSEMQREQEQETRKNREKGATLRGSGRDAGSKRSLRGVELEVVKGELVLVPSVIPCRAIGPTGMSFAPDGLAPPGRATGIPLWIVRPRPPSPS